MKKLLYNKRGNLDVRNTLGYWSVIKTIGDTIFIVLGANKFYRAPMEIKENPLLFFFWMFTIFKEAGDIPLTLAFLIGKWHHIIRQRALNKRKKEVKHGRSHSKISNRGQGKDNPI